MAGKSTESLGARMTTKTIVQACDLRSYFHGALSSATRNQNIDADDATLWYLSNLLTTYSRSERFFEDTSEGRRLLPLAEFYAKAVYARSPSRRERWLQRLGDVALFVAGLFTDLLERQPVDVDYYIAMGGSAYSHLGEEGPGHAVFLTLGSRFGTYVDVLAEIGEARSRLGADPLRTIELWRRTGSRRLEKQLSYLGLLPAGLPAQSH